MALSIVRLELARDPEFPDGSSAHGYEFVAPLTAAGHIDAAGWKKARERCRVRRFWQGEDDQLGHLVHRRGGTWAFHYDSAEAAADEEAGFKFDAHVFRQGEYVSLREPDGQMRTFRVVAVRAAPA